MGRVYTDDDIRGRVLDVLSTLLVERFVPSYSVSPSTLDSRVITLDLSYLSLGEILVSVGDFHYILHYSSENGSGISVCRESSYALLEDRIYVAIYRTDIEGILAGVVARFFRFIRDVFWYDGGIVKISKTSVRVRLRYSKGAYRSYSSYIRGSLKLRSSFKEGGSLDV